MDRCRVLTERLKWHDSKLFAEKDRTTGVISIYRKRVCFEAFDWEGGRLLYSRPDKYLIFSLTDTWTFKGKPVEWGIEPVMARIKEMDLWNRDVFKSLTEDYEKQDKSKAREFRNKAEDVAREMRPQMAKATNDFITSRSDLKTRRD